MEIMLTAKCLYNNVMRNVLPNGYGTIAAYADGMFAEKVPTMLRKYFEAERTYVKGKAEQLDEILIDLIAEKCDQFKSDPFAMLERPIRDLLKFDNPQRHQEVSTFVYRTIDECAYIAEQAAYKLDQIVHVKLETPIIRGAAKRALEGEFGQSNLPLTEILAKIEQEKSKGIMTATVLLETPYQPISRNELTDWYNAHISLHSIPSITFTSRFPIYTSEAIFERELHYAMHPYNRFFEKIIGGVGAIVNYFYNSFMEIFTGKTAPAYSI